MQDTTHEPVCVDVLPHSGIPVPSSRAFGTDLTNAPAVAPVEYQKPARPPRKSLDPLAADALSGDDRPAKPRRPSAPGGAAPGGPARPGVAMRGRIARRPEEGRINAAALAEAPAETLAAGTAPCVTPTKGSGGCAMTPSAAGFVSPQPFMRQNPKNPFAAPQFGAGPDAPVASPFAGCDDFSSLLADLDAIELKVVGAEPSDSPAAEQSPSGYESVPSPLEHMLRSGDVAQREPVSPEARLECANDDADDADDKAAEGAPGGAQGGLHMTALVSDHLSKLLEGRFDELTAKEERVESTAEDSDSDSDKEESVVAMANVWRGMRGDSENKLNGGGGGDDEEDEEKNEEDDEEEEDNEDGEEKTAGEGAAGRWRDWVHAEIDADVAADEYDFAPKPLAEVDARSRALGDRRAAELGRKSRDRERVQRAAEAARQAQAQLRERRRQSFARRPTEEAIPEADPLLLTR